ncbi:MAG: cobalamin-dependent protein [Candidatus Cloacimonetes bacterium]|nr:cobalamin-dependent protein [Candidatus Cloacimonadota bacterium]
MVSKISEEIFTSFQKDLLAGDRRQCSMLVEKLLSGKIDVRDLYLNLFQRAMYNIGRLWEYNKISVAVEHLATSITLQMLNLVYPVLFSAEKKNKSAVIACVANEYHQLGSQMVSDIFELNGWNGYYLGSNTPLDDLLKYVDTKKPDILGLSIAIYFNMQNLWKTVEVVRREFPGLFILVGGQAFLWGGREITTEFSDVHYAAGFEDLENLIRQQEN